MRSLLIQGDLIWDALRSEHPSEFDLLWQTLQSSNLQGFITQADLDQLYVQIAQTQGIDSATRIMHHVSRVLAVYAPGQAPPPDVFIIHSTSDQSTISPEVIPLSVSAFLERYTLELLYQTQPAVGRIQHTLVQWLRKSNNLGSDLLVIPILLTLMVQSLDLFKQVLAETTDSFELKFNSLLSQWESLPESSNSSRVISFRKLPLSLPPNAEVEEPQPTKLENESQPNERGSEPALPLGLFFPTSHMDSLGEDLTSLTPQADLFVLAPRTEVTLEIPPSATIAIRHSPIQIEGPRATPEQSSVIIEADLADVTSALPVERGSTEEENPPTSSNVASFQAFGDSRTSGAKAPVETTAHLLITAQISNNVEDQSKAQGAFLDFRLTPLQFSADQALVNSEGEGIAADDRVPGDLVIDGQNLQFTIRLSLSENDISSALEDGSVDIVFGTFKQVPDPITNPQDELTLDLESIEQFSNQGLVTDFLEFLGVDAPFAVEENGLGALCLCDRSVLLSFSPSDLSFNSPLILNLSSSFSFPLENG